MDENTKAIVASNLTVALYVERRGAPASDKPGFKLPGGADLMGGARRGVNEIIQDYRQLLAALSASEASGMGNQS